MQKAKRHLTRFRNLIRFSGSRSILFLRFIGKWLFICCRQSYFKYISPALKYLNSLGPVTGCKSILRSIVSRIKAYRRQKGIQSAYQENIFFQPDVVAVEQRKLPRAFRMTLYTIFACLVFGMLWSIFSSIDKIVTAQGKLITCERPLVVQPLETSVIRSIKVETGDIVKKNQVLATLDPTISKATTEQIQSKLKFTNALLMRLQAEQKWFAELECSYLEVLLPPPYFAALCLDIDVKSGQQLLQKKIFEERLAEFISRIHSFDFEIKHLQNNVQANQKRKKQVKKQLKVAKEIESMRYKLYKARQGSRLNYLQAYREKERINGLLIDTGEKIKQLQDKISKIQSERLVFVNQWKSKVVTELFSARQKKNDLVQSLIKASRYNELVELKASSDAIVKEVSDYSVGSVIKSAEPLVTLVPLDSKLEAEVMIKAKDIGRIKVGNIVRLKLTSFPFQRHGTLQGKVRVISPDVFLSSDLSKIQDLDKTGHGEKKYLFYKALIAITSIGLRSIPDDFALLPGMTVKAEIKVGKRRIISYLLDPIIKGIDESLHEP